MDLRFDHNFCFHTSIYWLVGIESTMPGNLTIKKNNPTLFFFFIPAVKAWESNFPLCLNTSKKLLPFTRPSSPALTFFTSKKKQKKKETTTPSNYIIHMVEPTFLMDPTPTSSQSPRVLFCYLSSSPTITYRKLSLLPPR